ncbi:MULTISPECIES: DUF2563 family protein [Mycobacterium]|uniref:DUF2563 family protein n=1 Tax=Mycobacterium TaxID=1763 RepID=UPI001EF08229|nr:MULTISPECIES: DUF2563 family protein [Mycobacterium]BDB42278.1 hypothetical protein IWGMT90018_27240 [Mycobacterium kiyosense]BDE14449.1 hypothetical protein MKCMC460_33090 [Mycobacterium sp. 20KCMC460]GLB92796.1 hypothetical protein SRL2020130_56130 [Mycobacterium kiyosense]GLC05013.1 hypothetical protein SRL2020400_56040 [Mycobacterium kiyosense]GLC10584.1 hypothetical protein SRL2020411_52300 [Mycobacterium kiyosense]
MFVDSAMLHSGSGQAHRAGAHAHQAAAHLSQAVLGTQMFGDFAAAEAFHSVAGLARDRHARILLGHRETLDTIADNAHLAAATFTDMDEQNAGRVRAVRCISAT